MAAKRGEIWLANLDPSRGSEQAGFRPVLILQNQTILKFSTTVLSIPLTTNLRRAALPTCLFMAKGVGGLSSDSVLLCHQLRALDQSRLAKGIGQIDPTTLAAVEARVLFTLGIR